ncbi:MAG: HD domain-containing protein [Gammaproteobacteria bacterium]|nr:HD domain-containing protein [Gammaproteobacteria bacterium]
MAANPHTLEVARPNFKSLSTSSAADWQVICDEHRQFFAGLPDRILGHLKLLDADYGGFPVDRLQHSMQTAELAAADGRDDEYVVCALLHDIGDTLGSANHPDVAAAILYPYVSEANHWMVKHHGIFQGYNFFHHLGMDRNMRDQFRGTHYYDQTEEFIARYDDPAFDADKPRLELALFEPMVRKVFAQPVNTIYKTLR